MACEYHDYSKMKSFDQMLHNAKLTPVVVLFYGV